MTQPMATKHRMRKHLFIDPKVQGTLAARIALYWVLCVATVFLMLLCWRILTGPARMFYTHLDDMWFFYAPPLIASFLLMPLVIVDIIRLSNRFAGPMVRMRHAMRELARGEHVAPIHFREGDFWHDFAVEFNEMAGAVQTPQPNSRFEPHEEPVGADAE